MQILKPQEEAKRELSAEQTVSSSKVIPLLNAILHELQKNVVDADETQVPESQDSSAPISVFLLFALHFSAAQQPPVMRQYCWG